MAPNDVDPAITLCKLASTQNHSLLYATHQMTIAMGIVAARAQKNGRTKSAIRPSTVNTVQKILRSTNPF
jgi:hypothetical protein